MLYGPKLPLGKMMRSSNSFLHLNKMPALTNKWVISIVIKKARNSMHTILNLICTEVIISN